MQESVALACRPNISSAGRRRRKHIGMASVVMDVALLVGLMWGRVYWPYRAVVFVPAALAALGFLQAARNTCVARAGEGTFEHDDFSTTKASDEDVAASRKVARTIQRDAFLIGSASAALAMATALLR